MGFKEAGREDMRNEGNAIEILPVSSNVLSRRGKEWRKQGQRKQECDV
jgi:hypothetical protein